jgi:transposase
MERFTTRLPFVRHLLAAVPRLEPQWGVAARLATPDPATRRSGRNRLAGTVGRRLVFPGKKGGAAVGVGRKGKGTTILLLTDRNDLPLSAHISGADEHEVNHIEPLLDQAVVNAAFWQPTHLVYDKGADSDPLRERLADRFVELVCPHRENRKRPRTQDGRKLRHYRHRWQIERSMSWLQRFKRLVVRYEYHADLFLGFVQLACLFTILQRF